MKHKRLNRDGWGFSYYPYYQMRIDCDLFHGTACLIKLTDGEDNYWETPKAGTLAGTGTENQAETPASPDATEGETAESSDASGAISQEEIDKELVNGYKSEISGIKIASVADTMAIAANQQQGGGEFIL